MRKLLPPPGVPRALALQSMLYAVGSGTFMAGSAVFFTRVVGLTARQVGLGLSVAGVVSFLLAVPLGALADRLGGRRTWLVAACVEAVVYALYPAVHGLPAFLGVVVALAVVEGTGQSGRSVYTMEVLDPAIRVRVMAYARSALNLGFTAGAGLAGLALWVDTRWAYYALALGNSAMLLVNAWYVGRLPLAPGSGAPADGVAGDGASGSGRLAPRRGNPLGALKDRPFVMVALLSGVLATELTVFAVVVPLWVVNRTDAPRPILAVLVIINTVLAVTLQVPASRGADNPTGIARAMRRAGYAVALGCAVLAATVVSRGAATIAVLVIGIVLVTAAELLHSAGHWGLGAHLTPAARRGEYMGVLRLGYQSQSMAGPALWTGLVMTFGAAGWLTLAVLMVAAGALAGPVIGYAAATPRLGDASDGSTAAPEPAGKGA